MPYFGHLLSHITLYNNTGDLRRLKLCNKHQPPVAHTQIRDVCIRVMKTNQQCHHYSAIPFGKHMSPQDAVMTKGERITSWLPTTDLQFRCEKWTGC